MKQNYQLHTKGLRTPSEISTYTILLEEQWDKNIYYAVEHMKYFEKEHGTLNYFLLEKDKIPIIVMPFILREIHSPEFTSSFYDVISPYGYNGPLFNKGLSEEDLIEFWRLVDQWYKGHNVVSEFIRFSLNNNSKNYSGKLINSLSNVNGVLLNNFEDQWIGFVSKVRNNFRKAINFDLKFQIFHSKQITRLVISEFYNIYISTMHRNDADKIYFFPYHYFENLIFSNINNFSIGIAYYQDTPISAELIINHKKTIFAFFGGTNSDYFGYRPNDFLRVNIIEWAIENGFKNYVLGGGMKDGDGLYKSKKCLFPKDKDVTFYTGRKIVNQALYNQLSNANSKVYSNIISEEMNNNDYFFPFYRAKLIKNDFYNQN